MSRYGTCRECGKALTEDEGYHICSKCGGYLCQRCAAISGICSKCASK